jgi:hypothetical protein
LLLGKTLLVVFLFDLTASYIAELRLLLVVLVPSLSVFCCSLHEIHRHKVAFLVLSLSLELLTSFFLGHCILKLSVILFLTQILCDMLLLLLPLEDLLSMFQNGAPLINVTSRVSGIVSLGVLLEGLYLARFLVKWLLNSVSHLERIHNCNFTSLHFYIN